MEDAAEPLAEVLRSYLGDLPPAAAPDATGSVARLRQELESVAAEVSGWFRDRPDLLPLRLPKGRLLDLAACQRFTVAVQGAPRGPVTPELLAGSALDRFVVHELVEGAVGDPVEDLFAMLAAEGEDELLEDLGSLDDLPARVAPLAAAARAFRGVDPAWWPRSQSQAGVELAGASVVSRGRVDVELGGQLTARPGVVVEVKSSSPRPDHLAEVRHYALLVALRDGTPPALAACWYPSGAWVVEAVDAGVLDAAAHRLADGIHDWARLRLGATPTETAGPRCGRCPDADVCPTGALRAAATDGEDPWEPEDLDDRDEVDGG